MLQSAMAEATSRQINIDDFEASAVKQFLELIYTGDVSVDPQWAPVLLLADKYEMLSIVAICVTKMVEGLSADTAVSYLRAVSKLQHNEICQKAKDIIKIR